jgi:transcriptional regulator with XRE-family HTH domain
MEHTRVTKEEEIAALAILIHDLRKHKKYTLQELADKIGRSVGFLSQVERGLSRPTVADLTAISQALDVTTTYFYNLSKPKQLPWVTRPDERRTLYFANGITDILVSPKMSASFSMLESLLEPGSSSGERTLSDISEQGGYVLEGELTLWLGDSDEPVVLHTGDAFQLDRHAHCRYGNLSEQPTRVLWVYT